MSHSPASSSLQQKPIATSHHDEITEKSAGEAAEVGTLVGLARGAVRATIMTLGKSLSGAAAGIAEETAGYPLDTIKTRMQSAHGEHANHGMIQHAKHILKTEGPMGFFSGLASPIAGAMAFNAVLFGSYGAALDALESRGILQDQKYTRHFLAGLSGGLAQCIIATPVDVVKNRMQVLGLGHGHGGGHAAAATAAASDVTSFSMARNIIKQEGIRGIFKGFGACAYRDTPGYAIYFASYELLKDTLGGKTSASADKNEKADDEESFVSVVVAGGTAGMLYHALTYPFDVVKTRIQIQTPENKLYNGTFDAMQKIMAKEGANGLMRGFVPTVLRAFPASGAGFVVYELALKYLPSSGGHGH